MTAATIVVPSYNRPAQLHATLATLCAQKGGADYEIVVVDDGSPEPLAPVCARFGPAVRCVTQENAGPAAARNTGAAAAQGTFLAFTDDDCRPRPGWLAALMAAQGGRPEILVGGPVVNGLPENPYASASQQLCDFLYDYFDAREGHMPFFTSNNLGCDAEMFTRLGGFDDSFPLAAAEDRDFGLRWRDSGGALFFAPDAEVRHYHDLTLGRFWRQHANYGRGARHLHRVLAARDSPLPRREPLAFYARLIGYPLRRDGRRGLPAAALMALSQLAMIRGYVKHRSSAGLA